ncbi:MAG: phenylalanine--tRNA ligase subunit alpha [Candidatus Aminicenantes bacterium]|nr:phenylalanine--tRNA ligase subunit alpha [Candidatus Aminicenantes bacterium]
MVDLIKKIKVLRSNFDEGVAQVEDKESLQELRNTYLSRKKGRITLLLKEMKNVSPEEKPEVGKKINEFKIHVQQKLDELDREIEKPKYKGSQIDLTLPGKQRYRGAPHPILKYKKRIEQIFLSMGFSIEDGPEIETDYYNFGALNFPPHHPARDDWDTLYLTDDLLLRTHTSPVQIRVMEKKKPPIRMINPGKVYRRETPDPTHIPMFYQVEGLVVDFGITFAHLKGTLEHFLKALYHEKIKIRFRPSYFPFTEPSAEVDIECTVCRGEESKCRVCGGGGWIEILGAGMVDPQVLKNVNIDPEKYSGFAFGMGIDRTAMFSFRIPDLRNFYENDLRFIRQFS